MLSWEQYKHSNANQTSVAHLLNTHREKKICENCHYIITISQTLLYCCLQEVSIQGHRESNQSQNRGNFLELLSLLALHDPIVKARIEDGPQNAKYTSPDI